MILPVEYQWYYQWNISDITSGISVVLAMVYQWNISGITSGLSVVLSVEYQW